MFIRDAERIARQMKRQRCDPEYIRHYLIETYQAPPDQIDEVFKRIGLTDQDEGNPMGESPAAKKRKERAKKFGL